MPGKNPREASEVDAQGGARQAQNPLEFGFLAAQAASSANRPQLDQMNEVNAATRLGRFYPSRLGVLPML
jgi:hypothetical protein